MTSPVWIKDVLLWYLLCWTEEVVFKQWVNAWRSSLWCRLSVTIFWRYLTLNFDLEGDNWWHKHEPTRWAVAMAHQWRPSVMGDGWHGRPVKLAPVVLDPSPITWRLMGDGWVTAPVLNGPTQWAVVMAHHWRAVSDGWCVTLTAHQVGPCSTRAVIHHSTVDGWPVSDGYSAEWANPMGRPVGPTQQFSGRLV